MGNHQGHTNHDEAWHLHPILDPGNAGAISAKNSGVCNLQTLAAETRTLASPTMAGIELMLCMLTDNGDCVVTAADEINIATNTIMTFANVRETIVLRSVRTTAGFSWSVGHNDSVALS